MKQTEYSTISAGDRCGRRFDSGKVHCCCILRQPAAVMLVDFINDRQEKEVHFLRAAASLSEAVTSRARFCALRATRGELSNSAHQFLTPRLSVAFRIRSSIRLLAPFQERTVDQEDRGERRRGALRVG